MNSPILFFWDGEAMVPRERFRKLCDKEFVVGDIYPLIVHESRSVESHRHYFAAVHDGWLNLPEDTAERFPSSEHLRKWCLIKAGYADKRSIVCASKAEARRVATFIRPMDEYAVIVQSGATIEVYTAQSQAYRAMGKDQFQQSKDKVLEIISGMIGVETKALQANAGQAA